METGRAARPSRRSGSQVRVSRVKAESRVCRHIVPARCACQRWKGALEGQAVVGLVVARQVEARRVEGRRVVLPVSRRTESVSAETRRIGGAREVTAGAAGSDGTEAGRTTERSAAWWATKPRVRVERVPLAREADGRAAPLEPDLEAGARAGDESGKRNDEARAGERRPGEESPEDAGEACEERHSIAV